VEGKASIGSTLLTPGAIGTVVLEKDQLLTTEAGKVEILLTPGVFLRVAENSSVKMVSPGLATTKVQLKNGRALVEVIQIRKENDIRIDQKGASTKLLQSGLYDFDADRDQVRVFKGKAEVYTRSQKATLTESCEIALNTDAKPKSQSFEPRQFEDELYRWSGLRSGFLSEASVSAARAYIGPGPAWYGPVGIGIPGLGSTHLCPRKESSTGHSAGDSTLRSRFIIPRSFFTPAILTASENFIIHTGMASRLPDACDDEPGCS